MSNSFKINIRNNSDLLRTAIYSNFGMLTTTDLIDTGELIYYFLDSVDFNSAFIAHPLKIGDEFGRKCLQTIVDIIRAFGIHVTQKGSSILVNDRIFIMILPLLNGDDTNFVLDNTMKDFILEYRQRMLYDEE